MKITDVFIRRPVLAVVAALLPTFGPINTATGFA